MFISSVQKRKFSNNFLYTKITKLQMPLKYKKKNPQSS